MYHKSLSNLTLFFIISSLLTSCKMSERFIYFQGNASDDISNASSPVIKPNDILTVVVGSDKAEAALPFNYPSAENAMRQAGGIGQLFPLGLPINDGYLVDEAGYIVLPVIGKVSVAGLTRNQLMEFLLPKYEDYITGVTLNIKIMNFRVSILGDVRSPGVKLVSNERITIIEAIALAGDLNPTANRKNILVIRERNNKRQEYRVDLTQKELFSSPYYYLEQNDIVYVEPNMAAQSQGTFWRTSLPAIMGFASFTLSAIILLTR